MARPTCCWGAARSLYTGTGVRPLTDEDRQHILAQNTAMAQQALRVLGSAYRDLDNASPADSPRTPWSGISCSSA